MRNARSISAVFFRFRLRGVASSRPGTAENTVCARSSRPRPFSVLVPLTIAAIQSRVVCTSISVMGPLSATRAGLTKRGPAQSRNWRTAVSPRAQRTTFWAKAQALPRADNQVVTIPDN
jgi:hypothetical protein